MLSQSVGYAASALGIIAMAKGKPVLIKDVAEEGEIPASYLGKLINTLARKGVVQTQRGIGGGVVLVSKPENLTLYDVCEMFDEPAVRDRCMLSTAECSSERTCPFHNFWSGHRTELIGFLKNTTIAHMAKFETREAFRLKTAKQAPVKGGIVKKKKRA